MGCRLRSGLHDGGTVDDGFGETGAVGGAPMDLLQPGTASAQGGGPGPAAASHHASVRNEAPHAKRKMSEMGEVGDQASPPAPAAAAAAAAAAAEEVQECDMRPAAQEAACGSAESGGDAAGTGLNRWAALHTCARACSLLPCSGCCPGGVVPRSILEAACRLLRGRSAPSAPVALTLAPWQGAL